MLVFGAYNYSGFGSTKITALHNYFINNVAFTYAYDTSYNRIKSAILAKVAELDVKFGGAFICVQFDDPNTSQAGLIRIYRGKSRQFLSQITVCYCDKSRLA